MVTFLVSVCLVLVTLAIPFLSTDVRRDSRYSLSAVIVLLIYTALSAFNAFAGTLHGTGADAMTFYHGAVAWADHGDWAFQASAELYVELLGLIYRTLGTTSLFVGQQFSVIGVAFSIIILRKFIAYLQFDRYRVGILLIFALLPSMLFRAGATMRESFEVLFVLCALYTGLRGVSGSRIRWIFLYILSIGAVTLVHKALAAFALFATIIFILVRQPTHSPDTIRKNKLWMIGIGGALCCAIVVLIVAFGGRIGLGQTKALVTGDQQEIGRVLQYKAEGLGGRTAYPASVNFSSPIGFITTLPVAMVYYQFSPFPWSVRTPLDVYGLFVAWLRLAFLLGAFALWRRSNGSQKRQIRTMLLMYGVLTAIWATGTTNYGTADRHNLTQQWIVILLGYPFVVEFCKRGILRKFTRRVKV